MSSLEIEKEKTFFEKVSNELKKNETQKIVALLVFSLFLRVLIALLFNTGHPTDLNNFKVWSISVNIKGIYNFFQPEPVGNWCDYPPAYIWVLYFLGKIYSFFDPMFVNWTGSLLTMIIKSPAIIADALNTYLIYNLGKRYVSKNVALKSATIFAFQPAIFYESAVWGQMDSVTLLFLILSIIFLIDKKYELAIIVTALNCMIKPQGILLIPLITFFLLYKKAFKKTFLGILYSLVLIFTLTIPITRDFSTVIPWLFQHYMRQSNLYAVSAMQSFNLWSFTGFYLPDSRSILGITHKVWGLVLYSLSYIFALYHLLKNGFKTSEENNIELALINSATIVLLAFFIFPTRIHERYLFSGLAFLSISACMNFKLKNLYFILSGVFFINLLFELPGDRVNIGYPSFLNKLTSLLEYGKMYTYDFGLFIFNVFALINIYIVISIFILIWKEKFMDKKIN